MSPLLRHRRLAALGATLALAGCFAGSGDDDFKPTTGDLALALTAPPGIPSKLVVTGPKGFKSTLTESGKLLELLPGDYTLSPVPVVLQTSLVDTVYTADVGTEPLKVRAGKTTEVSVAFQVRPGSGSLWTSRFGDPRFLSAFNGADLLRGNGPGASTLLRNDWERLLAIRFDAQGNLWLLAQAAGASELVIVSWRDLASPTGASLVTAIPLGRGVSSFTFDGSGGIWAASPTTNTVVRYTAAQLAAADTLEPAVTLHANGTSLSSPSLVFFDTGGNLWAGNEVASGNLVRFSARQIAATGYPIPLVTLTTPRPSAIAFDAGGSIWFSSGTKIYKLGATQQAASGTADLKLAIDVKRTVSSLAFDALGALWFSSLTTAGGAEIGMLAPGQITDAGAPTPFLAVTTAEQGGAASLIAFNPPPAGIPQGAPAAP